MPKIRCAFWRISNRPSEVSQWMLTSGHQIQYWSVNSQHAILIISSSLV